MLSYLVLPSAGQPAIEKEGARQSGTLRESMGDIRSQTGSQGHPPVYEARGFLLTPAPSSNHSHAHPGGPPVLWPSEVGLMLGRTAIAANFAQHMSLT